MATCVGCALLLTATGAAGQAQLSLCYAGFEISQACITERRLDQKQAAYQRKIVEAMSRLGASYKITLRLVNHPFAAGYESTADVFTDVVRNEEMRNESFIINVTAAFLEEQPDILFEASALHEVCHVMNDDLSGYHRNGTNTEAAEEHCVLQAVGESRYEQYLQAYAAYRHWDRLTYERVLQNVKDVALVPAPRETDEADRLAAEYFRRHADDGKEHFLVYNGELHDATLWSERNEALHDPEKLKVIIKAGKPMIFFHRHPTEGGRAAMFPGKDDFRIAGLVSFMTYAENPSVAVEFRVMQLGEEEDTVVSYGFKGAALEEIKDVARESRSAAARQGDVARIQAKQDGLESRLAQDAFNDYLQYVCPMDLLRTDADGCATHPEYFLWPSDRFFVHHRAH